VRVVLTHRIELKPTKLQEALFRQCVGAARFAYNWALAEWERQYKAGGKPNEAALRRQFNAIKPVEFPWILELPKSVPQQAIKNVGRAYQNFFRKRAKRPRFKKRGQHDSARLDNGPGTFACEGKRVRLPKIGWVRMREELRFEGKPLSVTLSWEADRWFISIPVEVETPDITHARQDTVGVDLGISTAITLSTGEKIDAPKPLKRYLRRLRRASRWHSRKQRGSANRRKSAAKLAKLHTRIARIRRDWTHQETTKLTRRFALIGIEDLNVHGMMANDRLARPISDIGFFELRRQLQYKASLSGGTVVVVDRWFPSSKTCSHCGCYREALPLSLREWTCTECGATQDRDVNAALNIQRVALATASWAGSNACGEEGTGRSQSTPVKPASMKQEVSRGIVVHG
jgi:putative transposase